METNRNRPPGRLRIGELAALAGTTPRAIRHYHAVGLLPEPGRDPSGYRRYGPGHVVRLVRIRRLREVGMPLDRIAASISSEPHDPDDLRTALRSLAADIALQIDGLRELRARMLDLAEAEAPDDPGAAWAAALRERGLLAEGAALPDAERRAVELADALHPHGIGGIVGQNPELLADPARVERLGELLRRFGALPDDAGDDLVETLAADFAAAIPRPAEAAPPVDVDTMDRLLGDRFSPAQLRCLHRIRGLLEAEGS